MARPRKPIAQLKSQNTFNVTRHGQREHEPSSGDSTVQPPEWLTGESLEFWHRHVPNLQAMQILDSIDESSLIGLCVSWSNWRKEQREYEAGTGHIYRVACAWNMFSKIASQFGFDPISRTKLAVAPALDEDDPFSEWLARGGLN